MKKKLLFALMSMILGIGMTTSGCANVGFEKQNSETEHAMEGNLITVGFSQVGAESDWRRANTESMKDAFSRANGYDLIYMDGQQQQKNQLTAMRRFIQQGVDYIVLAPVKEEGFNTALQEAKEAGIPVIIVDRMVMADEDLFTCFVGSNFAEEGLKMVEWLNGFATANGLSGEDLQIVNVQGTLGSSAQLGRTNGLEKGVEKYGWKLLGSEVGDYTQTKGREVMTEFLEKFPNLNVVYCENDNMAFGVIEALEEAGKTVGTDINNGDILVLSFDGVSEMALKMVENGKIACIAECNPLHGPRVSAIIEALEKNQKIEKIAYVDEKIYAFSDIVPTVKVDGTEQAVVVLGKKTGASNVTEGTEESK